MAIIICRAKKKKFREEDEVMKRVLSIILVICLLMSFAACGIFKTKYTVSFDSNGGTAVADQTVKEGEKVQVPTTPTKGDMHFVGWYADQALTNLYDFETPVNQSFTLYAKWTQYEGSVSATTSSVDSYLISNLNIHKDRMEASALVSAPMGCTLMVRFLDEEVYFSEGYPENKSYLNEDSLYASCEVGANADLQPLLTKINGTLPEYFVAEAVLLSSSGKELCNPVSFIGHTRRYAEFDATTIHDFADDDVVLQFSDSESTNFGVLAENVTAVQVEDLTVQADSGAYILSGVTETIQVGDKLYISDGEDVALIQVASVIMRGDSVEIIPADNDISKDVNLTDFYKFIKFDQEVISSVNGDTSLYKPISPKMALGHMRANQKAGTHGGAISIDLAPIQFETNNFTVSGDIDGNISASLVIEMDVRIFGEDYLRCDFTYTTDLDAYLTITDAPGAAIAWTEKEVRLGRAEIPFNIPGLSAFAELYAQIGWEADGGMEVSGHIWANQGFRYNTKDGYQAVDRKSNRWTLSCEGYAKLEFGPKPVVGISFLNGVVSGQIASFVGIRADAEIVEPDHSRDYIHACHRCADGQLFAIMSTDAELVYKLGMISGKPIDHNLVYTESKICDFYISLQNDKDSVFGGEVAFGQGECPNWIGDAVATEPSLSYSSGLAYIRATDSDGDYYILDHIGTCTDTDIIIPPEYNGLAVKSIDYKAFSGCATITSVVIPDSVTTIGWHAFGDCVALTSVTIGNSVTEIGGSAFHGCNSLRKLELGSAVQLIGEDAFSGCSALQSVTIPDSVTKIDYCAFYKCTSLKTVQFGNSLKTIGDGAFEHCAALTSMVIPDSVTTIGLYAFSYCDALTSVTIGNSVTEIGGWAFRECTSLKTVQFGNSLKTIGKGAFGYCTALISVELPNSVIEIGPKAFYNCYDLKTLTLGNAVETIGEYAFYNCDSITSVAIPDSTTVIGQYAFSTCNALTRVIIGNSVTELGDGVLSNCTWLSTIDYHSTVAQWKAIAKGENWVYGVSDYTIYCTDGSIAKDGTVTYN